MNKQRFSENNWRTNALFKQLLKALRDCKSEDQLANFLRDVATLPELQALSERLEVARLLGDGQTYRGATELTGASTATVARVARFLEAGEGGYRHVLGLGHWMPQRLSYEQRMKQAF